MFEIFYNRRQINFFPFCNIQTQVHYFLQIHEEKRAEVRVVILRCFLIFTVCIFGVKLLWLFNFVNGQIITLSCLKVNSRDIHETTVLRDIWLVVSHDIEQCEVTGAISVPLILNIVLAIRKIIKLFTEGCRKYSQFSYIALSLKKQRFSCPPASKIGEHVTVLQVLQNH